MNNTNKQILKQIKKDMEKQGFEFITSEEFGCKTLNISKPNRLETKKEIADMFGNL